MTELRLEPLLTIKPFPIFLSGRRMQVVYLRLRVPNILNTRVQTCFSLWP